MTFFSLSGIFLSITSLIMAMIMLVGDSKKTNILWSGVCASMVFLGLSMFMIGGTLDSETALMWWRIAYLGVLSLPVLVTHTIYSILEMEKRKHMIFIYLLYAITFIFHLINASGNLIEKVTFLFDEFYFDIPMNTYFGYYFIFFNLVFTYIFFILIQAYQKFVHHNKALSDQVLFLGVGIGFGAFGGYALYLPVLGLSIYPYMSILMMFYPIIIGYAILNHHLFDARYAILRVLRLFFIGIFLSVFLLTAFFLSEYIFSYTPGFYPVEYFLILCTFGIGIFLYHSRKISGIFLLSSLISLRKEMEFFLEKNGVYKSHMELISDLEQFFWKGMRIKKVSLLYDTGGQNSPQVLEYFQKYKKILVLSELLNDSVEGKNSLLLEEVRRLGEVIIPIEHGKEKDFFFLILGKKDSEQNITSEELKLINHIIPKIALALQILDFNHSLQEEVRIQTKALAKKNKELERAYEKLKEIDQNKDNFLAIASHELRTPMTIIKGYADLFLKNTFGPLSEDEARYMNKIYDNTESLIELVNNILDISKIEAGRMEKIVKKVDPHALLKKCVDNFTNMYEEKKIGLYLTDEVRVNIMETDESKVYLVLTNLLSNAYKFTPARGEVHVKSWEESGFLHVEVHDTGMGMTSDQLEHVFEKFSQSNNDDYTKKSIRGTGLGLNLCKQVIEMLGGTITVTSEKDTGSCFRFSIPLS